MIISARPGNLQCHPPTASSCLSKWKINWKELSLTSYYMKFLLSWLLFSLTNMCVYTYLICPQSTPSKNGWLFISSTPLLPILFSESIQNLEKGKKQRECYYKFRQKQEYPVSRISRSSFSCSPPLGVTSKQPIASRREQQKQNSVKSQNKKLWCQ